MGTLVIAVEIHRAHFRHKMSLIFSKTGALQERAFQTPLTWTVPDKELNRTGGINIQIKLRELNEIQVNGVLQ